MATRARPGHNGGSQPEGTAMHKEISARMRYQVLLTAGVLAIAGSATPVRAGVDNPSAATSYALSRMPVLSRVMFDVEANYFDKSRLDYRRMLLSALDSMQQRIPEIVVEGLAENN